MKAAGKSPSRPPPVGLSLPEPHLVEMLFDIATDDFNRKLIERYVEQHTLFNQKLRELRSTTASISVSRSPRIEDDFSHRLSKIASIIFNNRLIGSDQSKRASPELSDADSLDSIDVSFPVATTSKTLPSAAIRRT